MTLGPGSRAPGFRPSERKGAAKMGWKYIMVKNQIGETAVLFPIIFPDKLVHSQVYAMVKTVMPGWLKGSLDGKSGVKAVSAGTIDHIELRGLGGSSETLGLESRPEDSAVIEAYSYLHGVL